LAARVTPGQFLMLRLQGSNDPILGRPLALYDTVLDASGKPTGVDVVYLVVGKFTSKLAQLGPGTKLETWGPLGNGFAPVATRHLIMVAGGIGQTPFMALGREALGLRQYGETARTVAGQKSPVTQKSRVTLCYGARSAEYLAGVDDFRSLGMDVRVSTDDGSAGHKGLVTDLLRGVLDEEPPAGPQQTANSPDAATQIVVCGPERMIEAVAHLAHERRVACRVSLETPMACGIGICFSCVTKVKDEQGEWDYRRTCVEGPVFDAEQLVF
jgi:dihydroorotate dehydrogenase electron transfer subunit